MVTVANAAALKLTKNTEELSDCGDRQNLIFDQIV